MNIIIKGVSYTEKRAMELGIHPGKKGNKISTRRKKVNAILKEQEKKRTELTKGSESFAEKTEKEMSKK